MLMATEEKLWTRVKLLLTERGQNSLEISKQIVLQEKIEYAPLREALRYFMEEVWFDVLHPGLLSLLCEAVGGKSEETIHVGAALVLLAGGADVHDDIIDQSEIKNSKLTVFGKFGPDISILVGDALLLKGLYLLHEACGKFPLNKKAAILETVKKAFFKISTAEAKEASFRGKTGLSWQDYMNIIRQKAAVAEATAKIGAIIGNGTPAEIANSAHYGRAFGVLMTMRDEFVDVFETDELKNRAEKECLPLPILSAFRDSSKKAVILQLLKEPMTDDRVDEILDLTMDSEETIDLKREMEHLIEEGVQRIECLKKCRTELELLLTSTIENL
jgi:geranylgeranyl pyrophosphate synthase